jgi:hypothetical protein
MAEIVEADVLNPRLPSPVSPSLSRKHWHTVGWISLRRKDVTGEDGPLVHFDEELRRFSREVDDA